MSAQLGSPRPAEVWKESPAQWAMIGLAAAAAIGAFLPGLQIMVQHWEQVEEYSYGYFIPLIVGFLIWQKSDRLRVLDLKGSWSGLWLIALALLLAAVGQLSAIRLFTQYGFVVALYGVALCCLGWRGLGLIAVPLAFTLLMIPLPQFALRELSQQLQLVSSQLGVALIRLLGIGVFLEGNVIDLGSYKLQVVEACSGLRYLFPLFALGFLAAYFFKGALWKRLVIVLSTIPLTIVINSLRIAIIGVTVEHWGRSMAEGLLHDFEGWFMFMVCVALLVGEMSLLARIGGRPQRLRAVFGLEYPEPVAQGARVVHRGWSAPLLAAGVVLVGASSVGLLLPAREQIHPARSSFAEFPLQFDGGWQGRPDHLDREVLGALQVDDHFIANYARAGEPWVNFYSAYYASQSGGESTHSPRTCIPGGGWQITALDEVELLPAGQLNAGSPALRVSRALIQKGEQRQLVYYWFAQRGRVLTSEFAVKWFILRDSIARHRSDGALMRLVTPVLPSETVARSEQRLIAFLRVAGPRLPAYVPD
ncbi:VPLPA-CTERM-specific exosortase XrtD [Methylibium sp.]|uniref:VPLPA-CTERM-specific exosortase XrtD n=1 Tax=Methylibium sp. TaxID=2067992 RepID=UPI003D0B3612